MAATPVNVALGRARRSVAWARPRTRAFTETSPGAPWLSAGTATRLAGLGFAIILLGMNTASSGVLTENDVKKVETIKPLFQGLMVDLVETTKRPDISGPDAECIRS